MRNFCCAALGMFLLLIGCNIQDIDLKNIEFENLQSEIAVPFGTASYTAIEVLSTVVDPVSMVTDSETGILTFVNYETEVYLANESIEIDDISGGVRFTDHVHDLDFDINGGVDFDEVDSVTLRIITVNGLPFSATMDMYIVNASEDTLYTVLEKNALGSPTLNSVTKTVQEPKVSIDDIPFSKTGIDALNNGDRIRVAITMNSPESRTAEDIFVKLFAEAKLEVTLAARGTIDVKL